MKGDGIIFCLEMIAVLTFLYLIVVRVVAKKHFPILLVFVTPILSCLFAVLLLLFIASAFNLDDYSSLQVYFYIHSIIVIAFVAIVIKFW
jgi:hypothetical protein